MGRLVAIQHLRGLAVLGVVVFHALQWEWIPFEPGQAGVELFFVISGFVMWYTTAGRAQGAGGFLARRAARVVPLYWLASLTALAVVLIWPGAIPNIIPDPAHIALSLAFIPHLDPKGGPFPLLNPGWTLNYEAFFYLVFAACLAVPERWRAQAVTAVMAGVFLFGAKIVTWTYFFGANAEMLVFVAGIWLARIWNGKALPGRGTGLTLIALGLAILAVLTALVYRPAIFRPLLFGGPALLIAIGWLALAADRKGIPAWPWLQKLGDASYSIYLVHTLTAPLVARAFLHQSWIFIPVDIVVGLGAGLICHALVEKPLDRWIKGLLKAGRKAQEVKSRAGAQAAP
jgi:exopolysaccharide production protein ExoZ